MNKNVVVLGATGFLGRRVLELLKKQGIGASAVSLSLGTDLRRSAALKPFLTENGQNVVVNCAAFVGGIAFTEGRRADIISNNIKMTTSILETLTEFKTHLINPISNCIYPATSSVFVEEEIWNGDLHSSVRAYGATRRLLVIASEEFSRDFENIKVSNLIFPNLYGPGDHLDPVRAHALGALCSKIVQAWSTGKSEISIWGTGTPVREWMHVEDAARALVEEVVDPCPGSILNYGSGEGITIKNLALAIAKHLQFEVDLVFDYTKPDGAAVKIMNAQEVKKKRNWESQIDFDSGLRETVIWYKSQFEKGNRE